jgi:D-serine deaminase-like pyridoxal phosphate-dependent protein
MVRPGTYVFGDRQQLTLGSASASTIGLSVIATVIARRSDRIVTDAGGRALGRDHRSWLAGYGQLADAPTSVVTAVFDHHSVIELREFDAHTGDRVRIIPNNANSVVALHRSLVCSDGDHWVRLRSLL